MQTLTDSATWPATTLTVIGTVFPPPGVAAAPVQPAAAGGEGEGHLGLDVDGHLGPRRRAGDGDGQDQHQHGGPDGHERDDEQSPVVAQCVSG
jgi:hypothetical protein